MPKECHMLAIHNRPLRKMRLLIAGALTSLACMHAPDAGAFSLGAFEQYGLLINDGSQGGTIAATVNGNIGIGSGLLSPVTIAGDSVINGRIDCAGELASSLKTNNYSGIINTGVGAVTDAIDTASALSTYYAGTIGETISIDGSQKINVSGDGVGKEYIFNVQDSFRIGAGNTLEIQGDRDDYVILNVSNIANNRLDGDLLLSGGITSDHVLVNFTGTDGVVMGTAGEELQGTFLMPGVRVQLNNVTIFGRLFGAGIDGSSNPVKFNFITGSRLDQPPSSTPIPASALLMLSGTGLVGWLGIFKRRQRKA